MAHRLLPLLAVAAASLLVGSPVTAARPCHSFIFSFSAHPNPSNDPDHRAPITATVITIFRVRRFGPHPIYRHGHIHALPNHHHLHSIPANIQIRRPELPELPRPAADAAAGLQERAKDVLVVVVGLLFGIGCGALAAAACRHYDELYGEEDDEASDSESPKKVGYVIIPGVEAHGGGKN